MYTIGWGVGLPEIGAANEEEIVLVLFEEF